MKISNNNSNVLTINSNNDDNNNLNEKYIESLQSNINNLLEIAEKELDKEGVVGEKLQKIKRETENENTDIKGRHSNYSSNSNKKLNSSKCNSIASNNKSNVYIDKNDPNLVALDCKNNSNINKNNNNILTSNSNSDNYNSNFTFNNVASSQSNMNTENSPVKINKKRTKSYESNIKGTINHNSNNLNALTEPNLEDENSEKINLMNSNNIKNNFILRNYFDKKNYAFILFELNNFCFTQKDYFKNIYPELNLVMIIELNDCVLSQEKIFFYRTNDDNTNNIYYPFLKKEDVKYNKYRIIKPIEMNDEEFPIKLSINFFTNTNGKMLPIGNEDIFLTLKKEREMQKFNFYHNMHLKYVNKKVGNTFFNLAYKIDEIYPNQLIDQINNNLDTLSVLIIFITSSLI